MAETTTATANREGRIRYVLVVCVSCLWRACFFFPCSSLLLCMSGATAFAAAVSSGSLFRVSELGAGASARRSAALVVVGLGCQSGSESAASFLVRFLGRFFLLSGLAFIDVVSATFSAVTHEQYLRAVW
jgi:hypothetical protein